MPETLDFVHSLYCDFFERGVRYFFREAELTAHGAAAEFRPLLKFGHRTDGALDLDWMGMRYHLEHAGRPCTEDQMRLLGAIGGVLATRYRSIFYSGAAAASPQLFEGLAEDRYVSAFLDPAPYTGEGAPPAKRDVVADAIEVLRQSSLITHENRRIATGVILAGTEPAARATPSELP